MDEHNELQQIDDRKLQKIVSALVDSNEETDTKESFSECELNLSDISVEVEGIGNIELPLTKSAIEKIISISCKAKCGLCEQTIPDENVNNTHEIVAEKLRVNIDPSSMTRLLNTIHEDLRLDKQCDLTPHLHKMLIYSPGDFFLMHKDFEKLDNMIAFLVIVLPSAHIGGDLIIHQGDGKHVFSTENIYQSGVKCIAFYADCLRETEKVKEGYRVALTFDLVLNATQSPSNEVNQRLNGAIQNYFCDEHSVEPQKLVYFLNHQYSKRDLQWGSLRGNDRNNVSALLNSAKSLCLVTHLALAEIEQSFSGCDFSDVDEHSESYDRGNIMSSSTTFFHWVDASNRKVDLRYLTVADKEVCWTKGIRSFKPYKTKHTGYTDDESGRKVFWYRRAAVVLWAESRQIEMNFLLDQKNAIDELFQLIHEPGNENMVIDIIRKAGQCLYLNYFNPDVEEFISLSDIVLYVQDKNVAMEVLSHFSTSMIQISTAGKLAKLQNEYGVDWFIDFLVKLEKVELCSYSYDIDQVDNFICIFLKNKGDLKIAELLLEKQSVAENNRLSFKDCMGSKRKLEKLTQIFKACEIISNVSMLHKIIERVKANYKKYRILELVGLFLNLKNEISQNFYAHFDVLKIYLVNVINAELILGKFFPNDWSLKVSTFSCSCNACTDVVRFLTSETEVKSYPFQEKDRIHVCTKLRNLCLPIDIIYEKGDCPCRSFFSIEKKPSMHDQSRERYEQLLYFKEALSVHQF